MVLSSGAKLYCVYKVHLCERIRKLNSFYFYYYLDQNFEPQIDENIWYYLQIKLKTWKKNVRHNPIIISLLTKLNDVNVKYKYRKKRIYLLKKNTMYYLNKLYLNFARLYLCVKID